MYACFSQRKHCHLCQVFTANFTMLQISITFSLIHHACADSSEVCLFSKSHFKIKAKGMNRLRLWILYILQFSENMNIKSRWDTNVTIQAGYFKRQRIISYTLKCISFVKTDRDLTGRTSNCCRRGTRIFFTHSSVPSWKRGQLPDNRDTIPGILTKGTQPEPETRAIAPNYLE